MGETVLVVEDNPTNALVVEAILSRVGGFEVVCTEDGSEVLELVTAGQVEAVVMDVSLCATEIDGISVDGVELTRQIRSIPEGRHLPVVLLTAHAMRGDREHLLFSSGANDYVAKPIVDQRAFVDLIRRQILAAEKLRSTDEARPGNAPD
jgi:CheY-like chemotaxis protein